MKGFEEIKKIIKIHQHEIEKKYKVKKIAVFGSYVRGESTEGSDIDILVEFREPVGLIHVVSLENYLSDILGVRADVIPRDDVRAELKDTILKEAVSI